jgi:signal peptidase I
MSALTGLLYGALMVYVGGWYFGKWAGNFSFLLFVLTLFTLAYWLAERFFFAPRRLQAVITLEQQAQALKESLVQQGIQKVDEADLEKSRQALLLQPWWLDWTAGLFPVILGVFLLRSFLFEPFKIPSGSMIPTLRVGDLILVNKFHYGLRLPVINKKIMANHDPQRGDVMVFRYPLDSNIDYIKRVVAIGGDEVSYRHQRLYLNGVLVPTQVLPDFFDDDLLRYTKQFSEKLGEIEHAVLVDPERASFLPANGNFPFKENCSYSFDGVTCKVPSGHYFVMGDNRDNSQDSRYWGFVSDENIVGRAFFVWMNFGDFKRIGKFN